MIDGQDATLPRPVRLREELLDRLARVLETLTFDGLEDARPVGVKAAADFRRHGGRQGGTAVGNRREYSDEKTWHARALSSRATHVADFGLVHLRAGRRSGRPRRLVVEGTALTWLPNTRANRDGRQGDTLGRSTDLTGLFVHRTRHENTAVLEMAPTLRRFPSSWGNLSRNAGEEPGPSLRLRQRSP